MKILIAPWGNPLGWKKVTYVLKDESGETRIDSITTLKALYERYDHVIVLALESLIDLNANSSSPLNESYSSTILVKRKEGFENYESIESAIKDFIKHSLDIVGIKNAYVCVLPTFGSPGGRISFKGMPDDYLSLGLLEIEKILSEIGEEVDEISLDLSHGINFLTSMTVSLCDMITDVELIKKRSGEFIITKYYNSEPYSSEKKSQEYEIWNVYKTKKSKIDLPYMRIKEESQNLIRSNKKDNPDMEIFNNINREYGKIVKNIITAIYFPLPLLMEYFVAEASFKELTSDNLRRLWLKGVSVQNNLIEKHVSLNYIKVYSFLLTKALINIVKPDKNLESMKYDSKLIYKKISEVGNTLIGNEIQNLKVAIEKINSGTAEYKIYKEVIDKECGGKAHKEPDRRIMVAHAGFQSNYLKIGKNGKLEYTIEKERILDLFK
ncbi:CRISPR-associated CARF protein Csx1 [Cuniculiplasma sp. SKW4]|uniref:CRISPR-associated CARF protein Csx1 n=1 Tax=Cuniculiplasma sp. SKW4 TaxID=3400171 RepID=UPI003FD69F2B